MPMNGSAGSVNNFRVGKEPGLKGYWTVCPWNSRVFISSPVLCILPIILPSHGSYWSYIWRTVGHSSVIHRQMSEFIRHCLLLPRRSVLCWLWRWQAPILPWSYDSFQATKYPSVLSHLVSYGCSHAGQHYSCLRQDEAMLYVWSWTDACELD